MKSIEIWHDLPYVKYIYNFLSFLKIQSCTCLSSNNSREDQHYILNPATNTYKNYFTNYYAFYSDTDNLIESDN